MPHQMPHDNQRKTVRGLPPCTPSRFNLQSMIMETRHLLSCVIDLCESMPRSQKGEAGICTLMVRYTDRALYLTTTIADYASRHDREQKLRELNIIYNHIKELIITAFERKFIAKKSTMDHLATKIIDLSDKAVSYAQGLEAKARGSKKGCGGLG